MVGGADRKKGKKTSEQAKKIKTDQVPSNYGNESRPKRRKNKQQ